MQRLLERFATNPVLRWTAIGATVGLVMFAVFAIFRGQRGDSIVLEVRDAVDPNIVRVYVGGEVAAPGLYELPRGSRVADAINAAGGVSDSGDATGIGLAAILEDADQIIVGARAADTRVAPPTVSGGSVAAPVIEAVVNINTASVSQLETLPGIGPALAQRIIDYRTTNGPFQTVDELEQVSGISKRMVEQLRPRVTTGP